jgi:hypothetical protein
MEVSVSVDEIIHTCSNEKVAQAAVASIGFVFTLRVKTAADSHGLTVGGLAARIVREFGRTADECERKAVRGAMERSDHPILCGLRTILDRRIETQSALDHADRPVSDWSRSGVQYEVRRSGCSI